MSEILEIYFFGVVLTGVLSPYIYWMLDDSILRRYKSWSPDGWNEPAVAITTIATLLGPVTFSVLILGTLIALLMVIARALVMTVHGLRVLFRGNRGGYNVLD